MHQVSFLKFWLFSRKIKKGKKNFFFENIKKMVNAGNGPACQSSTLPLPSSSVFYKNNSAKKEFF